MMLPGVEFARKRRFYHHRETQTTAGSLPEPKGPAASSFQRSRPLVPSSSMSEEAAVALRRLDEKLRGLPQRSSGRRSAPAVPVPSSSSSTTSGRSWFRVAAADTAPSGVIARPHTPAPPQAPPEASINGDFVSGERCNSKQRGGGAGEEGIRSGAGNEVCAVCLDEVEGKQSTMWLPCSHKYHSNCVLPWLAAHPHCPCCRTPCSNLGITTQ